MKRKTKIACTIGPATQEVQQIISLFDAGMSVARFNFSHGTDKTNSKILKNWGEAKRLRPYKTCAMMIDIKGREIRIGMTRENEPIKLARSDMVMIRADGAMIASSNTCLQIDSTQAVAALREGDEVRMGMQGEISAEVTETERDQVTVKVITGGTINAGFSIKIPGNRYDKVPIL